MDIDALIKSLNLQPHPVEGGYFAETYRCTKTIPATTPGMPYGSDRNVSTAIYYLLTAQSFSELHLLPSDEVFHFYLGDCVEMLHLFPDGSSRHYELGANILDGQHVQLVVPGGVWQGCRLRPGGKFALLGCTVAPGFDYQDYQSGHREDLCAKYPHEQSMIQQLTREGGSND